MPNNIQLSKAVRSKLRRTFSARMRKLALLVPGELIDLALNDHSPAQHRSEAIYLLGLLAGLNELPPDAATIVRFLLKVMIENKQRLISWSVATTLAQIGDRSALRGLSKIVTGDSNKETRRAAVYALGRLGDRRATPVLLRVFQSQKQSTKLRAEAAEALGICGCASKRARAALADALEDRSPRVAFFSAFAIGQCARAGFIISEDVTPKLQRLTRNRRVLVGIGSLGKEATSALSAIRNVKRTQHPAVGKR